MVLFLNLCPEIFAKVLLKEFRTQKSHLSWTLSCKLSVDKFFNFNHTLSILFLKETVKLLNTFFSFFNLEI